ncbi:unnamed protein product, partial [Staurois parvus]
FTRAPDGGDGLETVPGQVTTSEQAHQWLRRPPGTYAGSGRARCEEDGGPSRVVTDRGQSGSITGAGSVVRQSGSITGQAA